MNSAFKHIHSLSNYKRKPEKDVYVIENKRPIKVQRQTETTVWNKSNVILYLLSYFLYTPEPRSIQKWIDNVSFLIKLTLDKHILWEQIREKNDLMMSLKRYTCLREDKTHFWSQAMSSFTYKHNSSSTEVHCHFISVQYTDISNW